MNNELLERIVARIIQILIEFMLVCAVGKLFGANMWLEKSALYFIFWELGYILKKSDIIYKNPLISTKIDLMIVFLVITLFFTYVVLDLSDLMLSLVIPWIIFPFIFSLFWKH